MPKKKEVPFISEEEGTYAPDAEAIRKEWDLNNPQPLEAQAEELPSGNRLKNNVNAENGISVIMPEEDSIAASDELGSLNDGGKLFIDDLAPTLVVEDLEDDSITHSDAVDDFTDLDDELLEDLDLEVNEGVKEEIVTAATIGSLATKFDATLDLKNYKYPSINLLETHGSEKIVQDPEELETHKNQIIATLKNYDIAIQRIAATVGPTVTLYEIVPAPGVRISRIKNLEDDIALSLAALGIRIIAPIPGKGTIGIEVPNIRKSVVSMKTLLSSEKFQTSTFSLPIAIGKKIDNENLIAAYWIIPQLYFHCEIC